MSEWNNDMCITFIEYYQMEPIIWNPKHPQHKDKNKVNDAWDRISKKLNKPIQELKTKKISLMATFRGHLRKKKCSMKSGAGINDIYKPIWFLYDLMESFLGDINECLPTMNTEQQWNNSQSVEIEEDSNMNEESSIPQSPIASTSQQPPQHPRRRAKNSEYLINEASKQMKDTFNTLNNVLKDQRIEEDECELYGKLLAKKLRGLPENERTFFMYEIDGMFVNRLRNSTPSPNFSSVSQYVPQRPTSSQSSYSEPLLNEIRISKRPNSSCTSYSEPAIPKKIILKHNITSQQPVSSHTARILSFKPKIIAPNHTLSKQNTCTPILHIPDPHPNQADNSQSVKILSEQVIVSPVIDYTENFNYDEV